MRSLSINIKESLILIKNHFIIIIIYFKFSLKNAKTKSQKKIFIILNL
jgi:hypothetical protein